MKINETFRTNAFDKDVSMGCKKVDSVFWIWKNWAVDSVAHTFMPIFWNFPAIKIFQYIGKILRNENILYVRVAREYFVRYPE